MFQNGHCPLQRVDSFDAARQVIQHDGMSWPAKSIPEPL
jgi:hypothetical protein